MVSMALGKGVPGPRAEGTFHLGEEDWYKDFRIEIVSGS